MNSNQLSQILKQGKRESKCRTIGATTYIGPRLGVNPLRRKQASSSRGHRLKLWPAYRDSGQKRA